MKKVNIFMVFGFVMIFWVCSFFAISSKAGDADMLTAGSRIPFSRRAIADANSLVSSTYAYPLQDIDEAQEEANQTEIAAENQNEVVHEPFFFVINVEHGQDFLLSSYRNPELRYYVVAFFREIARSQEIAEVILYYSCIFNIPPALAFSLCAEESSFRPRAFNRNRNETVDRGLFQLNSGSFPHLTVDEFYDIAINTRHGLAYLRERLDNAETEVAALAMYNAGIGRVSTAGTPQSTLNYISRILRRQRNIEERFMAKYVSVMQGRIVEVVKHYEPIEPVSFRLSLLTPLGR